MFEKVYNGWAFLLWLFNGDVPLMLICMAGIAAYTVYLVLLGWERIMIVVNFLKRLFK